MSREIKTIVIVLLGGILMVGGLFAYEVVGKESISQGNEEENEEPENMESSTVHNELEKEIDGLKNYNFNPQSYSILMTKIHAHYTSGSYTESIKISLENRLLDVYSQMVYTEAEKFLIGRTQNSTEILGLLGQIKQNGGDLKNISNYENQIKYYHYYSSSLPQKVSEFIRKGITNYSEEEYHQFKEEVNNMPNLDDKYKTEKFQNIKNVLIYNLGEFNMAYHIPTYQPEYQNF